MPSMLSSVGHFFPRTPTIRLSTCDLNEPKRGSLPLLRVTVEGSCQAPLSSLGLLGSAESAYIETTDVDRRLLSNAVWRIMLHGTVEADTYFTLYMQWLEEQLIAYTLPVADRLAQPWY